MRHFSFLISYFIWTHGVTLGRLCKFVNIVVEIVNTKVLALTQQLTLHVGHLVAPIERADQTIRRNREQTDGEKTPGARAAP